MINEWCAYDDVNVVWSGMVGYGDFSFTHYIGVLGTPAQIESDINCLRTKNGSQTSAKASETSIWQVIVRNSISGSDEGESMNTSTPPLIYKLICGSDEGESINTSTPPLIYKLICGSDEGESMSTNTPPLIYKLIFGSLIDFFFFE